jgi:hypothetical protein
MVRNEGDVIEAFVRHHAEVVDELVVVDHRSADGTGELLAALAAEGLPVKVGAERSLVHRQNAVMTRLMREAATVGGADWVVPLDADEFLIAPGAEVPGVLAGLPPERPHAVDMRPYVPTPDDPQEEANVLRRIQHRRQLENDDWTRKVVVPGRWARNSRFSLAQGSHLLVDARSGEFVPAAFTDQLALAHFPVRSADQLARKVLGGWPAHVARPDRAPRGAFQWKRAFDIVIAGRPLGARELEALAFDYPTREPEGRRELVLDPVPAHFELRYEVPREPTPLELLAGTAVQLAEELSDALRQDAADGGESQPQPEGTRGARSERSKSVA